MNAKVKTTAQQKERGNSSKSHCLNNTRQYDLHTQYLTFVYQIHIWWDFNFVYQLHELQLGR